MDKYEKDRDVAKALVNLLTIALTSQKGDSIVFLYLGAPLYCDRNIADMIVDSMCTAYNLERPKLI